MSNELMVIEVTDDMAPVVYVAGGLDKYFDMVKDAVSGEVPDLTTKKGRDRIACRFRAAKRQLKSRGGRVLHEGEGNE